jgi:hypothetical protein
VALRSVDLTRIGNMSVGTARIRTMKLAYEQDQKFQNLFLSLLSTYADFRDSIDEMKQ